MYATLQVKYLKETNTPGKLLALWDNYTKRRGYQNVCVGCGLSARCKENTGRWKLPLSCADCGETFCEACFQHHKETRRPLCKHFNDVLCCHVERDQWRDCHKCFPAQVSDEKTDQLKCSCGQCTLCYSRIGCCSFHPNIHTVQKHKIKRCGACGNISQCVNKKLKCYYCRQGHLCKKCLSQCRKCGMILCCWHQTDWAKTCYTCSKKVSSECVSTCTYCVACKTKHNDPNPICKSCGAPNVCQTTRECSVCGHSFCYRCKDNYFGRKMCLDCAFVKRLKCSKCEELIFVECEHHPKEGKTETISGPRYLTCCVVCDEEVLEELQDCPTEIVRLVGEFIPITWSWWLRWHSWHCEF